MDCVSLFCVQGILMGDSSSTYDSTSARTFYGELDTAIEGQVQSIRTLWGHSSVGCLRLLFCGR